MDRAGRAGAPGRPGADGAGGAAGGAAAERAARMALRMEDEAAAVRRRATARAEQAGEDVRRADRRCAVTLGTLADGAPLTGQVAPTLPATPLALAVAVAYAPRYRFDADEDHFPDDLRRWIAGAERRQGDQGRFLDPVGEDVRHGDLGRATLPFAYHVTADGDLQLEYGTFYPFNDFPDAPSPPGPVGELIGQRGPDHEGDFEPVTVQLGAGGRPGSVDFEAHGHTGVVPWGQTERDGLHPRVYVTHGGHGNNPHAGRYENDVSGATGTVGDHWEDEADGRGERWGPGAAELVDARSIRELRDGDWRFGEDQADGNPRSFLHPQQGPPPDQDEPRVPRHAGRATGVDEIGIAKRVVGEVASEVGDVVDDIPAPPLPSPPLPLP